MTLALTRAMIGAELLKLRRNRGLLALAALLTSGVVVIAFGFIAIRHGSDPLHHPPAGGVDGFNRTVRMLGEFFGLLAAALIGTEAGTADSSSGVFRDLVATGRSRLALFAVRAPAAVLLTLALTAVGFGLAVAATFGFADGRATPSAGTIVQSGGWIALTTSSVVILSLAVGSVSGSRAMTLTGVIGWELVASNLLLNTSSLGSARDAILNGALLQFIPVEDHSELVMATGTAILVTALWLAVPLALGAWRTRVRDA